MKKIKATIYNVDGSQEPLELPSKNRLEALQKIVGGYIEIIHINGNDVVLNEEGKLIGLPYNPWSKFITLNSVLRYEPLCGNVVVINGKLL